MSGTVSMPWMDKAPARALVAALGAGGARVRFVGGCVRDALIGREPVDIDLATTEPPETVLGRLKAAGIKAVPTGLAHGTVTAVIDHEPYEVTTLRRDVATDGRHAVVAYTDDWQADAERRDFTINAIYADPDGALFDPVGGVADLAAQRVRFVGDPGRRIAEDYLRVLRYFRFHARFGGGMPDEAALAACAAARNSLGRLSAERVAAELLKLLGLEDPMPGLGPMRATGVLAALVPEVVAPDRLVRLVAIEEDLGLADAVRRLGSLLPDATAANGVGQRLKLSNADKARLVAMHALAPTILPDMTVRAMRRWLHAVGSRGFADLVLLHWAAGTGHGDDAAWRTALSIGRSWTPQRLPVKGEDLVAAGMAAGPDVGVKLAEVERWWVDQDFRPDRAACLAEIKRLVATSGTASEGQA